MDGNGVIDLEGRSFVSSKTIMSTDSGKRQADRAICLAGLPTATAASILASELGTSSRRVSTSTKSGC